jgi:hypothetical protein
MVSHPPQRKAALDKTVKDSPNTCLATDGHGFTQIRILGVIRVRSCESVAVGDSAQA